MDLKAIVGDHCMENQSIFEWACSHESLTDHSTLASNYNFPTMAPDAMITYSSESDIIFSANNTTTTFYDPTMDLIAQDYKIHDNHHNLIQEPYFDEVGLDFLKSNNIMEARETILTLPQHATFPTLNNHYNINIMGDVSGPVVTKPCDYFTNQVSGIWSCEKPRLGHVGRTTKSSSIGLEEISKYFYMTITDAAKEMNIGLTVLKKRCRQLGISRWPHRKMKSLKSLINNVQELGRDGSNYEMIEREIETLKESKKLMEKMPELELSDRTKKLRQACFKANYKKRKAMQTSQSYLDDNKTLSLNCNISFD